MKFNDDNDRLHYLRLKYNVIKDFINEITDGDDEQTLKIFYKGMINQMEVKLEQLKSTK